MQIDSLTPDDALQLILRLKQGRNVIFGADLFSVGRLPLVKGAIQVFEDIERTGESVVRFLRGSPGVGKTNFSARVFHAALCRGWAVAYVEISDEVKFHEFHEVFADVVRKLYTPDQLTSAAGPLQSPSGLTGILDFHFRRLRSAVGLGPGADVSASARTDLLSRVNSMLQKQRIYGDFASAIRAYFEARIDDDIELSRKLGRWFSAEQDVRLPDKGVFQPISKKSGKEHLRNLTCLLAGIGFKGLLLIIDELEAIMEETRTRRRKAYTILRELMDNVDGENGMKSTCLYAAAPPGQFESQKGFIEVEPLASRIQTAIVAGPGEVDYTGTIVDLDQAPLSATEQIDLAHRLRAIHEIARSWNARRALTDAAIKQLVNDINRVRTYSNIRIREFCVEVVSTLERSYNNHN